MPLKAGQSRKKNKLSSNHPYKKRAKEPLLPAKTEYSPNTSAHDCYVRQKKTTRIKKPHGNPYGFFKTRKNLIY